jgi:sigma-E factor negative regulatory protein RseC
MLEEGVIISTDGPTAEVKLLQKEACGKCGACTVFGSGEMGVVAVNDVGAKAGDKVKVEVSESAAISASFLIFIFPLLGFFAGYLIVRWALFSIGWASSAESLGILGGMLCFVLAFFLIRAYDRRIVAKEQSLIKVVEILK